MATDLLIPTHTFQKDKMMTIITRLFAVAAMISVAGVTWAAGPDQVGTWAGSAKIITFTGGTNKAVSKEAIEIQIAADDSTTVTVGGVAQSGGGGVFNATDSFLVYGAGTTAFFATFNFKNTTMKGSAVGLTSDGSSIVSTAEVKYKLKKQ